MPRIQAILLSFVLLCVAGVADARKAELVNPDPIPVPNGVSQEQVVKSIKRALISRGWVVALEEPGHIESTLNLREHVARINVRYDTHAISIGYLDSSNLDYKRAYNGKIYIHPNYLNWINFLAKDMAMNMQLETMAL